MRQQKKYNTRAEVQDALSRNTEAMKKVQAQTGSDRLVKYTIEIASKWLVNNRRYLEQLLNDMPE